MAKGIPLDDPHRWLPLRSAIEMRQQQTGDVRIAVLDLEDKMRSGKLRAMRRDLATGKRARVERGFWRRGHEIDVVEGTGLVSIFRRFYALPVYRPRRWGGFDHPGVRLEGHDYFCWSPDLDALFGDVGALVRSMRKRPLPLDDPRWCPMKEAIEARQQQTGSMPLAIIDLEQAMKGGKLPSMRRDELTGKRELLDDAYWIDHYMDVSPIYGSVSYYRRSGERPADQPRRWFEHHTHWPDTSVGGAFFVWRPALDRCSAPRQSRSRKPKRKRAAGGGAKPVLSDEVVERGKNFFRGELDLDHSWRTSKPEACSLHVKDALKLGCSWETVFTWIVKPVLIERGLLRRPHRKEE